MRKRAWFVFILMTLTNSALQADILYSFERGLPSRSTLVNLEIQNGQIINSNSFPVMDDYYLESGAFDDSSGILYGWEYYNDSLCTIDVRTGQPTVIGGSGAELDYATISCLAINPITSDMFAMSWNGNLYQVNKTNGHLAFIGDSFPRGYSHGLAFSPDGVLYCSDTTGTNISNLYTINPETAQANFVAIIQREFVISIDFDSNGILYGADAGTNDLGIINTKNGQWTTLGSTHDPIAGMAFGPVPEPATLLLLGLGGLMIRCCRGI